MEVKHHTEIVEGNAYASSHTISNSRCNAISNIKITPLDSINIDNIFFCFEPNISEAEGYECNNEETVLVKDYTIESSFLLNMIYYLNHESNENQTEIMPIDPPLKITTNAKKYKLEYDEIFYNSKISTFISNNCCYIKRSDLIEIIEEFDSTCFYRTYDVFPPNNITNLDNIMELNEIVEMYDLR